MKRASLVHFLAIKTENALTIKASLTMKENLYSRVKNLEKLSPSFPIQAYKLLNAYQFKLKVIAKDKDQKELFTKYYESDSYGAVSIKINTPEAFRQTHYLEVYEVGKYPGLEILIGNYLPLVIEGQKKIVICDFDKTLVDTKYSSPEEVYKSLTSPIESFPTLDESVDMLQGFIKDDFHPFILSASPHFYEKAMRDWLYSNNIFTAGIFLKDYRKVFSFLEDSLSPKDIKVQGIYKLNHLLDIILMTDIPDEIVLMGDNFESDPLIYLTFWELIKNNTEANRLWKRLKDYDAFKLNSRQNSLFLNKLYQVNDMVRKANKKPKIKILIRKKANEDKLDIPDSFKLGIDDVELFKTSIMPTPKS